MTTKYGTLHTAYCRPTLATALNKQGYNIVGINRNGCTFGADCHGAHSPDELKKIDHVTKWESKDKKNIDLNQMRKEMIMALQDGSQQVKNPKYKSQLAHIDTMRFDELIHFWFDITCYHRKISKELKKGVSDCNGFSNVKDVPCFYLKNEDDFWALERVLHMCEQHNTMLSTKGETIHIKDICIGSVNCKYGVHSYKDIVCVKDMLDGKCDCTNDNYLEEIEKINHLIDEKNKQLISKKCTDANGFIINWSKNMEIIIKNEISDLIKKKKTLRPRMIHYTEEGLIPLKVRIEEEEKLKPKELDVEEIKTKTVKKIIKKKI